MEELKIFENTKVDVRYIGHSQESAEKNIQDFLNANEGSIIHHIITNEKYLFIFYNEYRKEDFDDGEEDFNPS